MPELFAYLLKINIAITLFYFGYFFFLKKLTFYSWNRMYLIFALVFSAIFPFFKLPAIFNNSDVVPYGFQNLEASLAIIPQVEEKQSFIWLGLTLFYWAVMALGATKLIARLASLYRVHARSVPQYWQGYSFRNLKEETAPFSFLGTIYLNREMHSDQELNTILKHEQEHTQGLHSLDVLLVEVWLLFSWFNPVIYFIKKAIKVNIEFIADREVVTQGIISHQQYQTSLVHFAAKSVHIPLVNQFSFLSLKSRIIMMNKKQSSKSQLGKYVLLIPLIVISLFIFGISKAYEVKQVVEVVLDELSTVEGTQASTGIASVIDSPYAPDSIPVGKGRTSGQKINETGKDSIEYAVRNPLYVIDGVQIQENGEAGIKALAAEDIESITVLKDESAISLYGDKGKNGVVLVTSKNGTKGLNIEKVSPTTVTITGRKSGEGDSVLRGEGQNRLFKVEGHRATKLEGNAVGLMFGDSTSTPFKVRGKEAVLYLIDGQPADGAAMLKLDPDRIESIEVIKEAKAIALYGDKGKDGVIIIKTKK